jgi:SAM-dependent methyltransferase
MAAGAAPTSARRRWRRWLAFALHTPLHPQWLVARHHRGRTRWVAERARGAVLDVGCADRAIAAHLRCESYHGLDYPATAVNLYGTRPDVFGDAGRLPFADASLDTVMLLDVVEHLAEPDAALAEAARVLKPAGRVLVTVPFAYPMHDQPYDFQRWTAHGWNRRLQRAGLQAVSLEEKGNAAEAAAANLCMALAQGALDALAARSWRVLGLVPLPLLIVATNLYGVVAGWLLPTRDFMPGGYYVEARRA